jgi:hypothetical protein
MDGVIHKVGGFSEVVVKYGDFSSEFAWLFGGKLGITLNDVFWLGGAYYFKVDNSVTADFRAGNRSPDLDFEYGGLDFEYMIGTNRMFHFTIGTLIGLGGYTFTDPEEIIEFENKMFFILEPGVNLELNVTEWLRLQGGVTFRLLIENEDSPDNLTFRYGRQVHEYNINSGDLSNIGFQFGVKFGGFE